MESSIIKILVLLFMGNCCFSIWSLQFLLFKCTFIPFQICCNTKETEKIPLMPIVGSFPSTCKHGEISPIWIKIHPQSPSSSSFLPHLSVPQKAKVLKEKFILIDSTFFLLLLPLSHFIWVSISMTPRKVERPGWQQLPSFLIQCPCINLQPIKPPSL